VLKIRFHTRLLKPRAYGLWLNSANSCEIFHFQLLIYNILLLLIELYVAWQLREGTQFSQKEKIRSSSIGQFD
jgi:hypothetical protein